MKCFKTEISFFISLFLIEIIFHELIFANFNFLLIVRIVSFSLFICFLLSLIFHKFKNKKIVYLIVLIIFSFYALLELQFSNFIGRFYSFNAVGDGLKGVTVFIPVFIRTIKPAFSLVFLPLIFFICINYLYNCGSFELKMHIKIIGSLLSISFFLFSLNFEKPEFYDAIKNHNNYEEIIDKIGINPFLLEDLFCSFFSNEEAKQTLEITQIESNDSDESINIDLSRQFDDSELINVMNNEDNETHKQIDKYILSRKIEKKNDKTGIFEGYNFIYFMVESFDYIAIDEKLTPTLYKLYNEGYSFLNHYTPIYVCGTGDSEWVGMTGTFPTMNECIAYNKTVDSHQSLAGLFKNAGYSTYAFHNWNDQFYPRTSYELNYGFDVYYDQDKLKLNLVNGWLSDHDLVEKSLPYFINDEHFFAFIITSTMHFPYDVNSFYGDLYMDEINKVHKDYPITIKRYLSKSMEFDRGLELLIKELDINGKLDNTVIAIYGDHHPKTIDSSTLIDCTKLINKKGDYATDMMPFIIYSASNKGEFNYGYCCNLDQLPTIANMFNLNYDPRLYCGSDIFSGNSAAIFPNGDFMTSKGIYHYKSKTFEDFGNGKASEYYYKNKNADIQNMRQINQAMIKSDYYASHSFVISPKTIDNN